MQDPIHSSPPSSEMELSRILQQPAQNGESSVQDMVTKYRKIKVLHPTVSRLCESPKNQDILRKSLQHDLSLIRGRSSRLDDHEISIAQKAYMLLMQNREDRLGGIELYVQEIIGLQYVDATESLTCLKIATKTRDIVLHRSSSEADNHIGKGEPQLEAFPESRPPSSIDSKFTISNYPISTRATTTTTKNMHEDLFLSPVSDAFVPQTPGQKTGAVAQQQPPTDGTASDLTDPKFQRLWSLFLEARADFDVQTTDNFRRTTAAKFLRDTIENCLSYISTSSSSTSAGHRQALLEDTLKLAIEAAELGSGGRKRRFDFVAEKKRSKYVVGGKFVSRRGGRTSGSHAAAHGNGGKQGMRHAARYKGYFP